MKIKGDTIKENKPLLSGRLYKITSPKIIVFEEKDTNDIVNIHFCIHHKQYGIYGNEYKPPFLEDKGGKKADILILVINEENKHFSSWIFDVKKSVGGEDVIYHLVEQLMESVRHKNSIAVYLEDYEEELHIGYITRDLQWDRIQETIAKKASYITEQKNAIEHMPLLIGTEARLKLLKEEAKLKILSSFQNNSIEIGKSTFQIESYISKEQEGKFVYHLNVSCK